MTRELVMGLDIGTTSAKAVIFDLKGHVLTESEQMIDTLYPQQGWVEQNPDKIEKLAVQAVRDAIKKANIRKEELLTIALSSAMHSIICVDKQHKFLSNALIWADGRSTEQSDRLKKETGTEIYERTGVPTHPMTPLTKLLWMKQVKFAPYEKASFFLSIKEYLLLKWFNKRIVDYSTATASGLLNARTLDWDDKLLEMIVVQRDQLSEVVAPTTILTDIKAEVADEMGIAQSMPFVIGSADGQLANLGIGAINPGEIAITAGTSGAIRQFTKRFQVSESHDVFCYPFTEEHFIVGGATNNGGIALQWLKELISYRGSFEELTKEAETVGPGAEGLIFLPFINGERAPLWNQQARGNFFGIRVIHKKEHFIRAVLEGITFNLFQIGRSLEKIAGAPEKIYINGGLSRSTVWQQMLADVFGKDVYVSESHHSAAWGAAWTGLVALGKVQSFQSIRENIPMNSPVFPNERNHLEYKRIYQRYEGLVKDISKHF